LKQWKLTEINNGSGHYRPSSENLQYVKTLMIKKGINTSETTLNDSLMRGLNLKEVGFFEK
jgi:type VI protein secretion system component Hcp